MTGFAFHLPISTSGKGLVAALGLLMMTQSAAFAQTPANPCDQIAKDLSERAQAIATIQSYQKKKPTADAACSAFTKLTTISLAAIASVERDGTWCHAPDDLAASLKAQQEQINKTKGDICKAAVEQKKAQANGTRQTGPLGGTGDILGGPVKLPQGAL